MKANLRKFTIPKLRFLLIFLFLFLFKCTKSNRIEKIEEIVHRHFETGDLHGTILIAEQGEPFYMVAFGYANLEWQLPNKIDTRYRIFSMSKQFTAMLIMQLVEEGLIALHEPISSYLPDYRKDIGDQVTIHHLLTHTHGILDNYESLPQYLVTDPIDVLINRYFSNDLSFEPGTEWKYGGLVGYMLLGAIVESVTDKSYAEVVQTEILDPAGMTNTTYLDFKKLIPKRATDYIREDGQIVHRIQSAFADGNGASGLVSTVEDLLIWDRALQSNLLLSQKYQDEIFKPQVIKYAPYYYGYGWYLADLPINGRLTRVQYHSGGGSCFIMRNVAEGHTIILLNNIPSDNLYDISLELLTAFQSEK